MPANTFGQIFRVTTYGESHGPAIGVHIDGVPPKLKISESDIQFQLNRRRPGQSSITTQRDEKDQAQILSGVFEGKTTGAPMMILIGNTSQRSQDYDDIKDLFRPGHADFTYHQKYGHRDYRGGGRSSGRETAARVAAGAVARKILTKQNINIIAYTRSIGPIDAENFDYSLIEKNKVRCPDPVAAEKMVQHIEEMQAKNDSAGGIIEAIVHGCPAGLGEPAFDKLHALLAHAVLSIGAVRGIEFGEGFAAARMKGSTHNDKFFIDGDQIRMMTNHAGGINGGISTGENIILRVAVKPTASISQKQQTVTTDKQNTVIEIDGRHDPCICPRIVPVVEAMIAITLVDSMMHHNAVSTILNDQ
ncbi:MAG: chorismate synthase [Candidatus Omnitrophica bacterium]|nr:chorismate synthase [Candidatus Omnitrophota bacterium]